MKVQDPGPVAWLKLVGVASLIAGVIGAIVLWSNASQPTISEDYFGTAQEETNPFIVMMGFVSLLQGILVWAVLEVYARMAENVAVIASNSESSRRRAREASA